MNNILCVISGHSELIELDENTKGSADSLAAIRWAAKELQTEIETHKTLIQAEKGDLSIKLETEIESPDLLNELLLLSNQTWSNRPNLQIMKAEYFILTTNHSLLFRVLYNMVKNAFEASDPTAVVSINCAQINGNGIFSVHNPDGMDRSTQLQVFQRSFSTKGPGRGLGTYSMKLFAEKYLGGKVWFTSSKAEGTTFFVSIPLCC